MHKIVNIGQKQYIIKETDKINDIVILEDEDNNKFKISYSLLLDMLKSKEATFVEKRTDKQSVSNITKMLNKLLEKIKFEGIQFSDDNITLNDNVYKQGTKLIGTVVGFNKYWYLVKFGKEITPVLLHEIRKVK